MKKLLLMGTMLTWGAAAVAQDQGGAEQCQPSALPVIEQTDVSTVERNADSNSAVIQLDVAASLPNGVAPTFTFSAGDGTIANEGGRATWNVAGAGPFTASVQVSSPDGCKTYARFTYHMEQTASE
jgi:hypothetical protein